MPPESILGDEQPGDDIHIIGPRPTDDDLDDFMKWVIEAIKPRYWPYASMAATETAGTSWHTDVVMGPRPTWDGWIFNHKLTAEEVQETACAY